MKPSLISSIPGQHEQQLCASIAAGPGLTIERERRYHTVLKLSLLQEQLFQDQMVSPLEQGLLDFCIPGALKSACHTVGELITSFIIKPC